MTTLHYIVCVTAVLHERMVTQWGSNPCDPGIRFWEGGYDRKLFESRQKRSSHTPTPPYLITRLFHKKVLQHYQQKYTKSRVTWSHTGPGPNVRFERLRAKLTSLIY